MSNFIDLTGMKFDRLTVIKRAENRITPNGSLSVMWECECECKNKIIVNGSNLRSGKTKSCGCLKKEYSATQNKKYNKYDLSGDFGIGYTIKGEEFFFDLEDYDKIKNYCWYINSNGYVSSHHRNVSHQHIYMHRLLMNFPKNKLIDHMNHKRYDNRKKNLRIVNNSQNNKNRMISKNNSSGFIGVYYSKDRNKWISNIRINGKTKYLGIFETKEDAIKARKEAEEKYFGEYSYDNSMKGDEIYEQESQI